MNSLIAEDHETESFARVAELLPTWAEVPLYRHRSPQLASIPTADCPHCEFSALPFVTKREMRENFPGNFLRSGQVLDRLLEGDLVELDYTSGTSEERVPVLLGRDWWSRQETAALRLNRAVAHVLDEYPEVRRSTLTTPNCNGLVCDSAARQRSERTQGSILYVNRSRIPFLQEESELARMAEEIGDWSPQFLDLDPVHGAWFALYCERKGIRFPSLQFMLGSYEFVSVVHQAILERVFKVPVLNLYGSTETGHLLMENDQGEMQPNRDHAYLEIAESDERGVGELIVTTLTNEYMPLLRYCIGDLVEKRGSGYVIHGRHRDVLHAGDGRRITTRDVDRCFTGIDGLIHYQVRQESNGDCQLRFMAEQGGPGSRELQLLVSRLEALLCLENRVAVEVVKMLPPTPSGKFRLTHRA